MPVTSLENVFCKKLFLSFYCEVLSEFLFEIYGKYINMLITMLTITYYGST
jgi:hypothetical protein